MFVVKRKEESSERIVHLMKNFVNSLLRQAYRKGSCLKPFFSTAVGFKSTFSKSIMSKLGLLYYKDSIVKDFTVLLMLSF